MIMLHRHGCRHHSQERKRRIRRRIISTIPTAMRSTTMMLLLFFLFSLLVQHSHNVVMADIGVISFWSPELFALLGLIERENNQVGPQRPDEQPHNPIVTRVFSGRRFYITSFQGHNIVAVVSGESITNSAATTAIMLQKFPKINLIVGSGIAGGVDPSLRIGDVVIPERWAFYQEEHLVRILENGTHYLRRDQFNISEFMGEDCGLQSHQSHEAATAAVAAAAENDSVEESSSSSSSSSSSFIEPCILGVNTWNFTFMYPIVSYGADPNAEDPTIESSVPYKWYNVDPELLALATEIASNVTLSRGEGEKALDYQPVVVVGGNGVAGTSFVDNAQYRQRVFDSFQASTLDMETASVAHVATQFGIKFIFFRSLSDLAGADEVDNALEAFYEVASENAVATMSKFLAALPTEGEAGHDSHDHDPFPYPNTYFPGDNTAGLLGVIVFHQSGLAPLKEKMNQEGGFRELIFGGRKFYRGTLFDISVVVALSGPSIINAAMTTALMIQLFPGVERLIGTGIAIGVDPDLHLGDVVIPERWALYREQLLAKDQFANLFVPLPFEEKNLVGLDCGGFDGVDTYLTGDRQCDASSGEASNFGFFFPKTVQTPEPRSSAETFRLTEGPTRKWWFHVDEEMLQAAKKISAPRPESTYSITHESSPQYMPNIVVGGNGVSGSAVVDNDGYRRYLFREFEARSVDREAGAVAHIAYQTGIPFLFLNSLSKLAGSAQDIPDSFYSAAAENGRIVLLDLILALYTDTFDTPATTMEPVETNSNAATTKYWDLFLLSCVEASFLFMAFLN